jgi:hypothetical protein
MNTEIIRIIRSRIGLHGLHRQPARLLSAARCVPNNSHIFSKAFAAVAECRKAGNITPLYLEFSLWRNKNKTETCTR